jgi:hypothetical protein
MHDLQSLKQPCIVDDLSIRIPHVLKEILQHAHVQRLSKAPRSGKKIHITLEIQQIPHEICLVNKIVSPRHKLLKIINTDWQRFSVISHILPS